MSESKKITIKQIFNLLNKIFPIKNQEEWDQSGLKLFNSNSLKISKVIVCLDCDKQVIDFAIKNKYKLIISHHPIFTKTKEFKPSKFDIKDIKLLKNNKISLLSLHTCVDNDKNGLNAFILNKIDAKNIKKVCCKDGCYFSAELSKILNSKEFSNLLFNKLDLSRIVAIKNKQNKKIKKIVLCCGSGFSVFKAEIDKLNKFDAVLTGDIKWHDWVLVNQCKWALFDIGHDVEKNFIYLIKQILESNFKSLSIKTILPNIDFYFKAK